MNFKNIGSQWIWRNYDATPNQYVTFNHVFYVDETYNAKLYIACDSDYVAYVNGKIAGYGQYHAYPENKYYDILEIDTLLNEGENILTVDAYYQGTSSYNYCAGTPGLIYSIYADGEYISDTDARCRKTPGFKEGEIYDITSQLGPSFEFDAREQCEEYKEVTLLEFSEYLPISLRRRPVKKLVETGRTDFAAITAGGFIPGEDSSNPAERIQRAYLAPYDHNKTKKLTEREFLITENNTFIILDLGGETTGYFTLELESHEGVLVDVGYGEHLKDGRPRTKIGERNFAFSYTTKSGENKFTNYFRRIGAKYLELNFSNVKEPVKLKYAGLIVAQYPIEEAPMPSMADSLDKKIYEISVNTLKKCMHEHFEDTPWREQGLYAMDARNQSLFGYYAFTDSFKFAKASIELMGSSLKKDGFVDICAPSNGKRAIPSFTMMWLVWLGEYVIFTKDKNFLMQNENRIALILKTWEKRMVNGLINIESDNRVWNFFEWEEGLDSVDGLNSLINMYFCYALKKLLKSEKHFRSKEIILKMKKLYKTVKSAVNKTFYDKTDKTYNTYADTDIHKCKLCQIMALCSGIAKRPKRLRKTITTDDTLIPITLSSKVFEYEALEPDIKKYGNYILNDIRKIWGNMVFEGADTFYETIKGSDDFQGAGSLCHGWSSAPIYGYNILFQSRKFN